MRAVSAAKAAGAEMNTGATVEDAVTDGDGVVVRTDDGRDPHADVIMAMDGWNRTARKISDDEPVSSGMRRTAGPRRITRWARRGRRDVVGYIGPNRHFIEYPLRRGELRNQAAAFKPSGLQRGAESWGGPDELEPAYAGCHENVRRGPGYLWRDRWWPSYHRDPIDNWIDGG